MQVQWLTRDAQAAHCQLADRRRAQRGQPQYAAGDVGPQSERERSISIAAAADQACGRQAGGYGTAASL